MENDSTTTIDGAGKGTNAELGDSLNAGDAVGDYRIEALLGSGGCANVYRAKHAVLGRPVALKVLLREMATSAQMVERFVREARIVNKLRHPAIVDIEGFGTLPDGRPYFVMELLEGRDLGKVLLWLGRMTPAQAIEYLEPVVSALAHAHAIDVVHRDIKPSNIMVVKEGSPPVVKLLDFGIAKLLRPEPGDVQLTTDNQRLGSFMSMAPEQILGRDIDQRCDVYALGVLLYLMLTGVRPFAAPERMALEYAHLNKAPPAPSSVVPSLSGAIDRVVTRALAKERADRFPTAKDFLDALKAAAGQAATTKVAHTGVGLGVSVSIRPLDADDDAQLDLAAELLEPLAPQATERGFLVLFETGERVMAARPLRGSIAEQRALASDTMGWAQRLYRQLARPGLEISAIVHVDEVMVEGDEAVGGRLVMVEHWPAPREGCFASKATFDLLGVEAPK